MIKLIVADLDNTLAPSKSSIDEEMSNLLNQLLEGYKVAILSGGTLNQFKKQVLYNLTNSNFHNLILLPTNGTQCYLFNTDWKQEYKYSLSNSQVSLIIEELEEGISYLKYWPKISWGAIIEDRESQITYSALGQDAPLSEKSIWDPDQKKRLAFKELLDQRLPEFEIKIGGATSIDITQKGIDKAFGLSKFLLKNSIDVSEVIFIGDSLFEGGNDSSLLRIEGLKTIQVNGPEETKDYLKLFIKDINIRDTIPVDIKNEI